MTTTNEYDEHTLRQALKDRGFILLKERGEDRYMIVDEASNTVVAGTAAGTTYGLNLEDVAAWLHGTPPEMM